MSAVPSKPNKLLIVVVVIPPIVVVALWLGSSVYEARTYRNAYERVEIREDFDVLSESFGVAPTYIYEDGPFRTYYFCGYKPGFKPSYPSLEEFETQSQEGKPPFIYNCYQFLIDKGTGEIIGKTWCGEEIQIHSIVGELPGTDINNLIQELNRKAE